MPHKIWDRMTRDERREALIAAAAAGQTRAEVAAAYHTRDTKISHFFAGNQDIKLRDGRRTQPPLAAAPRDKESRSEQRSRDATCTFVVRRVSGDDMGFCGKPAEPGRPFCQEHSKGLYLQPD